MRGLKVSKGSKKLDMVLVAARYDDEHYVLLAQGFTRSGSVWGDIRLFERGELIARVEKGERVVTGAPSYLPGDFDVFEEVEVAEFDGSAYLVAVPDAQRGDRLGLPLF